MSEKPIDHSAGWLLLSLIIELNRDIINLFDRYKTDKVFKIGIAASAHHLSRCRKIRFVNKGNESGDL